MEPIAVKSEGLLLWMGAAILVLATLACNAFAGRPQGLPPVPTLGAEPGVTVPAAGDLELAPTVTLPPDNRPSPEAPFVSILVDLNIRSGPGVQFRRVGFMLGGSSAIVLGRDPASGWWEIECPQTVDGAGECWVSGGPAYTRPQGAAP